MIRWLFRSLKRRTPITVEWLPVARRAGPTVPLPEPPAPTKFPPAFLFPTFEGVAKYWTGIGNFGGTLYRYRIALPNFQASAAPGTGDDVADNYAPGSVWVDKSGEEAYICLRASAGAAVWKKITAIDGGGA